MSRVCVSEAVNYQINAITLACGGKRRSGHTTKQNPLVLVRVDNDRCVDDKSQNVCSFPGGGGLISAGDTTNQYPSHTQPGERKAK